MTLLQAIILGIIQGLTEFIPVSSTAHLLIGQEILGIPASDATFSFLVLVQWGTLVSLFVYFGNDLWAIAKAFLLSIRDLRCFKNFANLSFDTRMAWYIILATIPALIAGYLLKDTLETLFSTPLLAATIRLFAAAILLSLAEWLGKHSRALDEMNGKDALIIGLFQIFAIFPGASRSGSTISGGLFRGFDRKSSARFAFLMSIPVMLAAGAYKSLDLIKMPGLGEFTPILLIGFLTAAIIGWLAIRWLMDYLNKRSLYSFAIYCALLGALTLGFYLLG